MEWSYLLGSLVVAGWGTHRHGEIKFYSYYLRADFPCKIVLAPTVLWFLGSLNNRS